MSVLRELGDPLCDAAGRSRHVYVDLDAIVYTEAGCLASDLVVDLGLVSALIRPAYARTGELLDDVHNVQRRAVALGDSNGELERAIGIFGAIRRPNYVREHLQTSLFVDRGLKMADGGAGANGEFPQAGWG